MPNDSAIPIKRGDLIKERHGLETVSDVDFTTGTITTQWFEGTDLRTRTLPWLPERYSLIPVWQLDAET